MEKEAGLGLLVEGLLHAPIEMEHIVRPAPPSGSLVFPLLCRDAMWLKMPMQSNPYRAYAFVLRDCPSHVRLHLSSSLSSFLSESASYSFLTGRYDPKVSGIVDSNDGIPFTSRSLDMQLEDELAGSEELLYRLADLRAPEDVRWRRAPLMTISLCIFASHTAVLTVSASHAVLDGEALTKFVAEWAAHARVYYPKTKPLVTPSRRVIRRSTSEGTMADTKWKSWLYSQLFALLNYNHLRQLQKLPHASTCKFARPQLTLSAASVRTIKSEASPPFPSFVTTQAAVVAHMMVVWWGVAKGELALCSFWLSGRKYLREAADAAANYLFVKRVEVPGSVLDEGLMAVASHLHNALQAITASDVSGQHDDLEATSGNIAPLLEIINNMGEPPNCAFHIKINNLSKIPLPTFCPGGEAMTSHALSMAGPTALLATSDGGLRICLQNETLPKGATPSQLIAVMQP